MTDDSVASRGGIESLNYLLDEAFRGRGIEESNESQALITNLATVPEADWRRLPAGAARTIESIVLHVGSTLIMYDDYAFGAGTLTWVDEAVQPWPADEAPMPDAIDWLERSHRRFAKHLAELASDEELDRLRKTNWGEMRPTRWIVAAMITHDAYHAGEINHIRSILGPDDRWRFIQLGFG